MGGELTSLTDYRKEKKRLSKVDSKMLDGIFYFHSVVMAISLNSRGVVMMLVSITLLSNIWQNNIHFVLPQGPPATFRESAVAIAVFGPLKFILFDIGG